MKGSDFTNDISFHDSTLERVVRDGSSLILQLDSVAAHLEFIGEHSDSEYVVLDSVEIHCSEANTQKLEFWEDAKAPIEHPEPDHPIDEIMKNELEDGILEISGFGPSSGWVVWQISASQFRVRWQSENRQAKPIAEQGAAQNP